MPSIVAVNYFRVRAAMCKSIVALFLLPIFDTERIFTWK